MIFNRAIADIILIAILESIDQLGHLYYLHDLDPNYLDHLTHYQPFSVCKQVT